MELNHVEAGALAALGRRHESSITRSMSARVISRGTWMFVEGERRCRDDRPIAVIEGMIHAHPISLVAPLRPEWPSCRQNFAENVWMKSLMRFQAATCASL